MNTSEMTPFSWLDYTIFAVSLGANLAIGGYFGFYKTELTISSYLFGGRKMKTIPIAASLIACNISSLALLSVPVEIYLFGANYIWINLSMIFVTVLTLYVFLPVFYNLQLTSIYEYLERRFDKRTRLLASCMCLGHLLVYLPTVLYILALSFSTVSGINVNVVALCISCICIFYTAFGGLKSVIWNDLLQMVVMVVTLLVVLALGIGAVGGPSAVWTKSRDSGRLDILNFNPDPTQHDGFWSVVIGLTVTMLSQACISQSSMLKFQSVPTYKQSKMVVIIFGIGMAIMNTGNLIQGLVMYTRYSDCDPLTTKKVKRADGLISYYVTDMARGLTGLSGIFIAGIFSAGLSTVSTHLNSLSGVIYKDFVVGFLKKDISEATACKILKLIVVITGIVCTIMIFIVQHMGTIFQFLASAMGLSLGPQLGMFTLGVLVPKANAEGSFYGAIGGLISLSVIFVTSKYYERRKMISYPRKPLSVSGCQFFNQTSASINTTSTIPTIQAPAIFRISFYYYPVIGFIMTVLIGTIISYLTKRKNRPVDKKYIAPICHSLLPVVPNDGTSEALMKTAKV